MISKNRIVDIQNSNYGYPKFELWISKNQHYFRIYPKFDLWISLNWADLRISINRLKGIHKSNYRYPKFSMIF